MSDAIYEEKFITLTEEQKNALNGEKEEEDAPVSIMYEPDPEDIPMTAESDEDDGETPVDLSSIVVAQHNEDLKEVGERKKVGVFAEEDKKTAPDPEPEYEVLENTGRKIVYRYKEPEKRKSEKKVLFSGSFGKVRALYLDVYTEGVYLILVEDEEADFSYSPPESDDIIKVTVDGAEYNAVSPGINFSMPGQKVNTTVLLIIKGD